MEAIRYGPPLKLYDLGINVLVDHCTTSYCSVTSNCRSCKKEFRFLPNTILLDFYKRLYQEKRLCILSNEFSEFDVFTRLLYVKGKTQFLIQCYQAILIHGTDINNRLEATFEKYIKNKTKPDRVLIEIGLKLGSFLNEAGWYDNGRTIFILTEKVILRQKELTEDLAKQLLECYRLRLYAEIHFARHTEAPETYKKAQSCLQKLEEKNCVPQLAGTYTTFAAYHLWRNNYKESYEYSKKALKSLSNDLNKRVIIDVLRHVSRTCVVKRKFKQAGLLIRQAMSLGEILYTNEQLPSFSDVLLDYGFYLLNSDSIGESVNIYEKALRIRNQLLEKNNINIAIAHEDLAYALYVNEYSSGNFWHARDHVEKAIKIMEKLLPEGHLMIASVKRVKALILEEMALDERSNEKLQKELLVTAEQLHKSALELSIRCFGEKNLHTAKHYGNLGRLYQSMKKYEEAEKMHLKAIAIKEELLGPGDYEVGLSIGHLASLYNYHMKRYKDAEKLYIRSIEINLNLFGPSYSGLEYDYRGLINVYNKSVEPLNVYLYVKIMKEWKALRDNIGPTKYKEKLMLPTDIAEKFFEIEAENEQKNLKENESSSNTA